MDKMIKAIRHHDFSAGHRVVGHEGACSLLHGHNYRVEFVLTGELDTVGRVIDFGVIKSKLCMWLEKNWDHQMLLWEKDEVITNFKLDASVGVVIVPFNPTAENMAKHLVEVVGPKQLKGTGAILIECKVGETRKCSASYSKTFL